MPLQFFFQFKKKKIIQLLFLSTALAFLSNWIPYYSYGILIIVFDYLVSLERTNKNSNFFKVLYISSSILFAISFQLAVITRIILIAFFVIKIYFDLKSNKSFIEPLKINNPVVHIIITHILYFLPLIIISEFFYEKVWYLSGQIILFLILRFIDSQIKGFVNLNKVGILYISSFLILILYLIVLNQFIYSIYPTIIISFSSILLIMYSLILIFRNETYNK